jgi:hypothetical protein
MNEGGTWRVSGCMQCDALRRVCLCVVYVERDDVDDVEVEGSRENDHVRARLYKVAAEVAIPYVYQPTNVLRPL